MLTRGRTLTRNTFPTHSERHVVWNGHFLRVRCYPKKEQTTARFSVVVSKKQYKTTVARNRFKRRILMVVREHLGAFDRSQYWGFVVYPKHPVEEITFAHIKADIVALSEQ